MPTALMEYIYSWGVHTASLTDHDTIAGLAEAAEAAQRLGLEFINGIEISAEFPTDGMHILGFGFQVTAALEQFISEQQTTRGDRNTRILQALQRLGLHLEVQDILAYVQREDRSNTWLNVGRPHFAMVLLQKGYIASYEEAFAKYLAVGRPAYVERTRVTPLSAITAIKAAGGVAVLAHPLQLKISHSSLEELLLQLREEGLAGIEAMHPDHSQELQQYYQQLAAKHGLMVTGGSDFHGTATTPQSIPGHSGRDLALDDSQVIAKLYAAFTKLRKP